ncbi:MAG: hypothetical protein PUH24_00940 [Prevotellaceae bacterium]|nr:hypothetical protein [Prevotella sp.]MDD7256847.1 hypothetical protein [Prevotellaceae bacterium]MDY6131578.1 hypothetical protein [Prevotella sp.]
MSQKRKAQRARKAVEEEKKGRTVVNWILGALLLLTVISMLVYVITLV